MTTLIFAPRTGPEIQSGVDFYAARDATVVPKFLSALERTYERIRQQPRLYGRIDRIHRAARVRRFPFLVVYRIRRTHIDIVAVHHTSKGSYSWRS